MKKVALLAYDDFSLREVADLMYLFRWSYEIQTVTFASSKKTVVSEEGIRIQPEKTFEEFHKDEYCCLVLSGGAELAYAFADEKLFQFLRSFKGEKDFPIGAICAGPLFLSMSGLLKGKKFVNSVGDDFNARFHGVEYENIVYAPVVCDGNIITALGEAPRRFAIAMARACGFSCRDKAMKELSDDYCPEDFMYKRDKEDLLCLENEILPWFEVEYQRIKGQEE